MLKCRKKTFKLSNLPEGLRIIYKRYYLLKIIFCVLALVACLVHLVSGAGITYLALAIYLFLILVPPIVYRSVALKIYHKHHDLSEHGQDNE